MTRSHCSSLTWHSAALSWQARSIEARSWTTAGVRSPSAGKAPRHSVLKDLEDLVEDHYGKETEALDAANLESRLHPRYVGGDLLPRSDIVAAYALAFFAPGALEVFESLLVARRPGDATLRIIDLPASYINHPYTSLAMIVVDRGAIPIGMLRQPTGGGGVSSAACFTCT